MIPSKENSINKKRKKRQTFANMPTTTASAVHVSYNSSKGIWRCKKKTYNIAENLVLPGAIDMVEIMFG